MSGFSPRLIHRFAKPPARGPSRPPCGLADHSWLAAMICAWLGLAGVSMAQLPAPVQTYFLALPEQDVQASFQILENSGTVGNVMRSATSITVTRDNTVLYYDQWEDGYENDIGNPSRVYSLSQLSGTQIWGDGDESNGKPPGFATDALMSGDVITLTNDIPLPRSSSQVFFDGRDKVASSKAIAVTRAQWLINPGPVLAGAVELFTLRDTGTEFIIPIGQDIQSNLMFEHTSISVMAMVNGTKVDIDRDADGSVDTTRNLNQGETVFIDSGIFAGAKVTSTRPVQVHAMTGNKRTNGGALEGRWFSMIPRNRWGRDYYCPVGSVNSPNQPTEVFIHNPNASPLTATWTGKASQGTVQVPARSTRSFLMPVNSAANLQGDGEFFAVAAVAAGPVNNGSSAEDNDTWDWGFTLVPTENLTPQLVVGWGPGADDANNNGVPDANGSPVFVTATANTTVYVDYDGNPATGPLTDPVGNQYDVALSLARLAQQKVFNPGSGNSQTGMKLYTLDGTLLTGAWGPDVTTAGTGNPFLDLGTTIPPHPWPKVIKTSREISNANGTYEPNDVIEYTITVDNLGVVVLTELVLTDPLPSGLTYIPGSTLLNGQPYPDNATGTPYPLDGAGVELPPIDVDEKGTVVFRARINGGVTGQLKNVAFVNSGPEFFEGSDCIEVNPAVASPCVLNFTDSSFNPVSVVGEGDGIYIELQDQDLNRNPLGVESFTLTIINPLNGDEEYLVVTETGVNTGVFRGGPLLTSPEGGQNADDGLLALQSGQQVRVSYQDPFFAFENCTVQVNVFRPDRVKQLYLTGGGPPYNAGLDRNDPVANGDTNTRSSGVLSASGSAGGGVTLDYAGSAVNPGGTGGVTLSTFPTTSSADRLMLVGVAIDQAGSAQVSGITYAGRALTQVTAATNSSGPNADRVEIWSLVNPPSGNSNVVVSMSGQQHNGVVVVAATFSGVDQGDPLDLPVANAGASVTVPSDEKSLVFGMIASGSSGALSGAEGQVQLRQTGDGADIRGAAVTRLGAGAVTLSWTGGQTEAAAGVSIRPVQSGDSSGVLYWHRYLATEPFFKTFDGESFGSAQQAPDTGSNRAGAMMAVASPVNPKEAFLLELTNNRLLLLDRWDGDAQTLTAEVTQSNTGDVGRYMNASVAYEQSGEALLVHGKRDDTSNLYYRTWNGSAWSSELSRPLLGSREPRYLRAAASPSSDEIVVAYTEDGTKDNFALVWNGSGWTGETRLDPFVNVGGQDYYDIDVAYETLSGRAMVVYGRNESPGRVYYRFWDGGSWSGEASLSYPSGSSGKVYMLKLASDLKSNRIAMMCSTAGNDCWAAVWNGGSWQDVQTLNSNDVSYRNASNADVAFASATGRAMAVWHDNDETTVRYSVWTSSGGWSAEAAGPDVGEIAATLTLHPDPLPTSRQIMLLVNDAGADMTSALWDGSAWTNVTQHENDTGNDGSNDGIAMTFFWDRTAIANASSLASSAFFPQIPAMATDFEMPAGGLVTASAFISVTSGGTPGTATSQISSNFDDAEEEGPDTTWYYPGAMYLQSTDLELVRDDDTPSSGAQKVGLRFNGLTIPKNARVTSAHLTFTAVNADWPNTNSGNASITIRGQTADNPGTFTYSDFNISSRATTTAAVDWSNIPAWTTGVTYDTPDLRGIVQELVNRAGWSSGNSMVFIINGTGTRSAASYEGSPADAPRLTIHYVVGDDVPANPDIAATILEDTEELVELANPLVTAVSGTTYRLDWSGALASTALIEAGNSLNLNVANRQPGLEFQLLFDSITYPSQVQLPTNTVIEVQDVAVYDARYPGGNRVTSADTGQTLYVRAVVSDPFGAYDVTAADLVINQLGGSAGDLTHAFVNDEVVATTNATKVFEFEWFTTSDEGAYDIVVTADEGTEGVIRDSGGTRILLNATDTGTPSETVFLGVSGQTRSSFDASEEVCVQVTEFDHAGEGFLVAGVEGSFGLSEMRVLVETGPNTGIFAHCYPAATFAPGEQITATYVDFRDPTDSSSAVAVINDPIIPPTVVLSHAQVLPSDGIAPAGSEIQFFLKVSNPGATRLDQVSLTDTYPVANLEFVSATLAADSSVPGTLTWPEIGPMDQWDSVEITVTFRARQETPAAVCTAEVTATATEAGSTTDGPISASVEVTRPEVTLTKTLVSPASGAADLGADIVFRIGITNSGSTPIPSLPLRDEFGSALEYVSATIAETTSGFGVASWSDLSGGSLLPGQTVTLDTTFRAAGRDDAAPNVVIVSEAIDVNGDPVPRVEAVATVKTNAALVGDRVWRDQNGNGVDDVSEAGIKDVIVYADLNTNGVRDPDEPQARTDDDGAYQITSLPAGSHWIRVDTTTLPSGVIQSFDPDSVMDDSTQTPVMTLEDEFNEADFGYSGGTGVIGGQVRHDSDGDGDLADNETGLQGVVITLWTDPDSDGLPDDGIQMAETSTDAAGNYSFTDLAPGSWVVVESNVAGSVSTGDKDGNSRNSFDQIGVTLVEGETTSRNDFLDSGVRDYGDFASFGDAASFTTSLLRIGAEVDAEPSARKNSSATGDDLDGVPDDEDGMSLPGVLAQGASSSLSVTVTNLLAADAYLNVWVDFNGDGTAGAGEQIASNLPVSPGAEGEVRVLPFAVPLTAMVGEVGVRARLTTAPGPGFANVNDTGEVEDHLLTIVAATDDFGDFSSFGPANSRVVSGLRLGALVDVENAAALNASATGDDASNLDDEDGVLVPASLVRGGPASLGVTATNSTGAAAYLNAWIDFNGNGSLVDTGEQVAADVLVADGSNSLSVPVNFTVPAGAQLGSIGVRVRLTSVSNPGSTGAAGNGEVEDYVTTVVCPTIAITPNVLPTLKQGVPVNQTFSASAGGAPITWVVSSGSVPPGLTLSSGGVLSGTPTGGAVSSFTIRATDNFGCFGSQAFSVRTCPILTISPNLLPAAEIGVPYSATVVPGAGSGPYLFSVASGTLPAGLSLNTASGAITGTPTTAGVVSFTIRATDANGCTDTKSYSLNPSCPVVAVSTASLPDALLGTSYSQSLAAVNGNGGYTWTLQSGSLPPGLILSSSGLISGTPSSQTAATYGFVIRVVDGFGCAATRPLTLRTCPASLIVAPLMLPGATVGTGYSTQFSAGGAGFAIQQSGSSGIVQSLANADAVLAGTNRAWNVVTTSATVNYRADASVEGNFGDGLNFPIAGANDFAVRATGQILIPTSGVWTFGTNSDDGLRVGVGGVDVIVDDTLHAVADRYGQITLAAGVHDLELVFFERGGTEAVELFAAQGSFSSFNAGFRLIGGAGGLEVRRPGSGFTWSVASGALPSGLALNPGTGVLSGTPTSPSSQTFTIRATDAEGCSGTRQYTLQPACPAITVSPSVLPNAEVGSSYAAQSFAATGGSSPYTWNVSAGSVPAGMILASGGQISGTPTTAGLVTFTVRATDSTNCTGSQAVALRICPVITLGNLTDAVVGQAYNGSAAASGGAAPYLYQLSSGSLPPGMTLNTSTGAITGTANAATSATFTVQATDANGCVKSRNYTLAVACPTVVVSPTTLSSPTVGVAFSQNLSASGGTAPYTYAVASGALPTGLALSPAGVLSGTATSATPATFQVRATDANGCPGVRSYTVTPVCPAVTLSAGPLAFATQGSAYTTTLAASGGTVPYSFAVTSGTLPNGLSLGSGGQISGTPTGNGLGTFTVRATDANGCFGTRTYDLRVCPILSLANLPAGVVGTPYSGGATASGGTGPYVYALQYGTLPTGLSLNTSSGAITGTPTVEHNANFTVRATDANGCARDRVYTLAIDCPTIAVGPATLTRGEINQSFSATVSGTGGTAPYTYAVSSGSLPAGLTLNPTTGQISGTPTVSGVISFTVEATDTHGCAGTRSYDLRICPAILISPSTLANGVVGTPYSRTFSASAGTGPYVWQLTGTLPTGLMWNASSATISGTPTSENAGASLTVTATDANGCVGSSVVSLQVVCPVISISPATLPAGYPTMGYSQTLAASNGTAPFAWTLVSGNLPAGLSLAANGTISGTPTQLETQSFRVSATDAYGCEAEADVSLTIKGMTLGNLVFEDYDNDGIRDPGETGVAGAVVELYDPGDDLVAGGSGGDADTLVAGPLTTDGSGAYQFTDLTPGKYFVKVTAPADFLHTSGTPVLGDTDVDDDNNGSQPGGAGTPLFSSVVSLDPLSESVTDGDTDPDTNLTVDFGLWAPMAVGNVVFFDFNGNGVLDATEGVEGVVVELYPEGADPAVTDAVGVALSDNKGRYSIANVNPGRYFLHIPPSQFASGVGPLSGTVPMPVAGLGDDDSGQDLLFTNTPSSSGVNTDPFGLLIGQAPAGASESGFESGTDDAADARVDLTRDLGFVSSSGSGFPLGMSQRNTSIAETTDAGVTTFSTWSGENGLDVEGDSDSDGWSNLVEYALGTDPDSGVQLAESMRIAHGGSGIEATVWRAQSNRDDVVIRLEGSSDLGQAEWAELDGLVPVGFDSTGRQILRAESLGSRAAFAGAGRGFVRLRVDLDADRNGVPEATAHGPAFAWNRMSVDSTIRTLAMPLLRPAIFSGTLTGVSDAEWLAGTAVTDRLTSVDAYYLEITDGSNVGERLEVDVAASTAGVIRFVEDHERATSLPTKVLRDGVRVSLRPHWTIGTLLPSTTLRGGTNSAVADQVMSFDTAEHQFETRWLLRRPDGAKSWLLDGDVSMADAGRHVLAPAGAVLFRAAETGSILQTGEVRESACLHVLVNGAQLVGSGWPHSADPASGDLGKTVGATPEQSDRLRIWAGDQVEAAKGYWSYQLIQAADGTLHWQAESNDAPSETAWQAFRGVFFVNPSEQRKWLEFNPAE